VNSAGKTRIGRRDLQQRIDAARGGSAQALGSLLAECRDYLLLVADRELDANLRVKVSPSDMVQETFIETQRHFTGFVGNSEPELLAWLRRILINKMLSARRKYRDTHLRNINREISLNDSNVNISADVALRSDSATPSQYALLDEQLRGVELALASLPADYQQVLRLRYWDKLPLTQIAQQMERTPDAVQKLWFRAVERFKREFTKDDRS
jgi:RNA polymerase sigma-70 factor (ECF subfamily)